MRGRKGVRERVEGKRGQVEVIRDIVRRYRPCSATIEAAINLIYNKLKHFWRKLKGCSADN